MPRHRILALTSAAAALLFAAGLARADRVDAVAPPAKPVTLTVAAPGDVATTAFLVQDGAGKKVSIAVKLAKKSPLRMDVRLVSPDGTVTDPASLPGGKVKVTPTSTTISFNDVPPGREGLWRVEVRGTGGTAGACTVTVKSKDVTTATGSVTVPAQNVATVPIDAGSNQTLTLTLKRGKGASITPRVRILDPNGTALEGGAYLGVANSRSGVLTLKTFRLPVFGRYTLEISGEGNGGGAVTYVAKTAAAKPVRGAPVASAGDATDAEPSMVATLDGSESSAGAGGTLAFLWTQIAGPAVALSGSDTAGPTFVAPDVPASLAFELAVRANGVWSAPSVVTVEVGERPLADAGRSRSVATGAAVTLDGSGSLDRRGNGVAWIWRQDPDDAVQVTLAGGTTASPTFTAPAVPAVLRFGLVVDDGSLRSVEDFVTVRVGDAGEATADAGRGQVVPRMATVHLSGLATESGTGVLDVPLQWTQVSGPAVTLDNPQSAFPAFTAPKSAANLAFELTAEGSAAKDRVWVFVRPDETNAPPVTRANGPQSAASGPVALNASSSTDPDGNTLRFRWAQMSGAALAPADAAAGSTTVPLPAGNAFRTYGVQTNDGLAYGPPEFVAVRNTGFTGAPVANAGIDQTVQPGNTVNLDGRSSGRTQGAGPVTYRWRQVSGRDWFDVDAQVPAFDPLSATPSFALPTDLSSLSARRTLTFELVVNDGASDSAPDYMTVTFLNIPTNGKPVVTAGASTTNPIAGQLVTLQGTKSDRDGDPVTVRWTLKSGPAVTLTGGATSLTPSFTAPASGTLVWEIVGNDGIEDGAPAQVSVVVNAAPTASLRITPSSGPAGTAATIDGTQSSDPEGGALTFTLTQTAPASPTLFSPSGTPGVWTFTSTSVAATFRLVVNDGRQDSQPVTATFSAAAPISVAPSASASSAPYGGSVTLSANATGNPTSYTWTQLRTGTYANDPVVTLTGSTSASATLTVPKPTGSTGFGATPSATIQLTATNGSTSDVKTVKVDFFASFNNSSLPTADTVYGIIASNCTSCHTGTGNRCPMSNNAANYGMGTATAFRNNSINVNACSSSKQRISSGQSSTNSYLVDRVKGIGGSQMGSLSGGQIALIEDWILQGALNN